MLNIKKMIINFAWLQFAVLTAEISSIMEEIYQCFKDDMSEAPIGELKLHSVEVKSMLSLRTHTSLKEACIYYAANILHFVDNPRSLKINGQEIVEYHTFKELPIRLSNLSNLLKKLIEVIQKLPEEELSEGTQYNPARNLLDLMPSKDPLGITLDRSEILFYMFVENPEKRPNKQVIAKMYQFSLEPNTKRRRLETGYFPLRTICESLGLLVTSIK